MTNEEIKKIAQSYVDELFAIDDMQDQENIEAKNDAFVMCMAFAGHILENHCIVPKEKLDALQDEIHGEIMCAHDEDDWQSVAHYIFDVMPRSFNGLFGKDMFEEEKI